MLLLILASVTAAAKAPTKSRFEILLDETSIEAKTDPLLKSYYNSFMIAEGRQVCSYKRIITTHFLAKGNAKLYKDWKKHSYETGCHP